MDQCTIGWLLRWHVGAVEIGSPVSQLTIPTGSLGVGQSKRYLGRVGSAVKTSSRFKRVAVIVFTVQAAVLIGISTWLFAHFDLTWDYAVYFQPWYLLAHGHLNPFTSVGHSYVWKGHLEWLLWPLALLYFLYPHGLTLLVVQDLAIVGAEVAALGLMRDLVRRRQVSNTNDLSWLLWVGLFFLVANPWSYWAVLFDFHFHSLEAFAITAATWQFYRGNIRWGYVFVVLCMVTSVVSITFLVPLAVLLLFLGQRRNGVVIGILAVSAFIGEQLIFFHSLVQLGYVLPSIGTTSAASLHKSSNLISGLAPFLRLLAASLHALQLQAADLYANLGPDGLLGILSPFGLFVPGLVLLESALAGSIFIQPGTQNVPAYALLAVGTVSVLIWVATRSFRISRIAAALLVANELVWLAVGIMGIPERTAVPSNKVAGVLQILKRSIPPSAEVITNQGIIGRFSDRQFAYAVSFQGVIPIKATDVYFILTPYSGINRSSVPTELSRVAFLAKESNVQLITHSYGVWAFKWSPTRDVKSFSFGGSTTSLPAWAMNSAVGSAVVTGNSATWYLSNSKGNHGYLLSGGFWRLSPGNHQLSMRLSSQGPVNVEVWNATANVMLLRRTVNTTGKVIELTTGFNNRQQVAPKLYKGWGLFTFQPVGRPPNNQIEVRVWTSGRSSADIFTVGVQ